MEGLSWVEVERYLQRRRDILIPIGSTEEHGLHLPLATDSLIAQELARAVGERTGILVAPLLSYGVCKHTAPYPGTISVSFEALRKFVESFLEDLWAKGFKRFYLLTGHAGLAHRVALREACEALVKLGAEAYVIVPYEVGLEGLLDSKLEFKGYPVGHADEVETSLMLYLRPELVEMERAVDEMPKRGVLEGPVLEKPTKSGVFGRPSLASREKGEKIFSRMVEKIAGFIKS